MTGDAFARLALLLPEALLLVNRQGVVRYANPAAASLLGKALPGRSLADFAQRGTEDALARFLGLCARSGSFLPGTYLPSGEAGGEALHVDGALLRPGDQAQEPLIVLRLLPKKLATAQFAALNLKIEELNREIARRRDAERRLREERELLAVTLSSIGDAVIATDPAGRIAFMNPVAERETGWTQAEAAGRPLEAVFVIVDESSRRPAESPVARVLREKVIVGLANHTLLIRRDGTEIPIDDAGAPMLDGAGQVLGVVLVFRTIAERRALEREREQAARRKDQFLAMLAHELRNPLAAIAAGVDLIRLRGDGSGLSSISETMHRQVRHLARLVDDLLDVSRIVTGKISLRLAPAELDGIVEDALAVHRLAAGTRAVRFEWQPAGPAVRVHGDRDRLTQVVGNLLSNAIKFSPPEGTVRLRTGIDGDSALFEIEDAGEGIPPDLLPSIFELFVQGEMSLDRSRGGLGIGLTVAKLVTELHGGTIEARSGGAHQGARFRVRLPLLRKS